MPVNQLLFLFLGLATVQSFSTTGRLFSMKKMTQFNIREQKTSSWNSNSVLAKSLVRRKYSTNMKNDGDEEGQDVKAFFQGLWDKLNTPISVSIPSFIGFTLLASSITLIGVASLIFSLVLEPNFDVQLSTTSSTEAAGQPQNSAPELTDTQRETIIFNSILTDLDQGYVDPIKSEKLFETGVRAMLGSLDPYTEFENNRESKDLAIATMGRYGGVGLGIAPDWKVGPTGQEPDKTGVRVMSAMEGYAFDSDVRPGDHLVSVDGLPVEGRTIQQVTDGLRGKPGTTVEVELRRDGVPGTVRATLQRRVIRVKDVPLAMTLGDPKEGLGYMLLRGFTADAGDEVAQAVRKLSAAAPGGELKGLVVDLRGNPGGLLSSAVNVAETFLPSKSLIVSVKGRGIASGVSDTSYASKRPPLLSPKTRLAVLTGPGTASAAEIVSGAIQDHDRGVIIGQRTYGKGLVQQVVGLPFENSLKFTIAKYYTPSGRCIQSVDYSPAAGDEEEAPPADGKAGLRPFRLGDRRFKATKIQDKDRKAFRTDAGRLVRDGGGVEPDVKLDPSFLSEVELQLLDQNAFANFASEWAVKHGEVGKGDTVGRQDLLADDATLADFKAFVKDAGRSGFKPQTRFDGALEEIADALREGGLPDAAARAADAKAAAQKALAADFDLHREEIRQRVEDALRTRYEPESARIAHALRFDKTVEAAAGLLKDPAAYARLLTPPGPAAATTATAPAAAASAPAA